MSKIFLLTLSDFIPKKISELIETEECSIKRVFKFVFSDISFASKQLIVDTPTPPFVPKIRILLADRVKEPFSFFEDDSIE